MKKTLSIITIILFAFSLPGCCAEPRFTNFSKYENDFTAVADFLTDYYARNNCSDEIIVDFTNGTMFLHTGSAGRDDDIAISADDLFAAVTTVENQGFDYALVSQDYLVFWKDETHYYGLLHSHAPKHSISVLREWYTGMDTAKINSEWYEIGALNSI